MKSCTLVYLLKRSKREKLFLYTEQYLFLRNTTSRRINAAIVY